MDRASDTEAVGTGSIPRRVKPKDIKKLVLTVSKQSEIKLVIIASPGASKTCRAHHILLTYAIAEITSSKLNTTIVCKIK